MASAAPELPALARDRAFESLYRRYVDDVYRYALALLRNPADAEDVTQTTFMNAYRAVKRGDRIEKPQNWLIKIAHNAARTRYARAARRVDEVPLEDHLEQLAVPEVERVQVHEVLDALGRLPLNQRAALVMRELEGRTYAEIADTLDVSVSAVETLIFRARRSLRVKASAVRVLGVVPAPGWLWNLLEGGGGLAGGGAAAVGGAAVGSGAAATGAGSIVGSGFLLKAAVAVVAGVIAAGINSDRPREAGAARSPLTQATATAGGGIASWTRILGGQEGQPVGAAVPRVAGPAATGSFIARAELGVAPNGRPDGVPQSPAAPTVVVGSTGPAAGGVKGSPASAAATPASAIGTTTQAVATTVGAVVSTVPLPAVPSVPSVPAVSAVPVSVSVPSVPVQVPQPPVQLPSPPPVKVPPPPVQLPPAPVQLPQPPVPLPHP
jgi:RNA polymerase sigma factor (sigma-70 family)